MVRTVIRQEVGMIFGTNKKYVAAQIKEVRVLGVLVYRKRMECPDPTGFGEGGAWVQNL